MNGTILAELLSATPAMAELAPRDAELVSALRFWVAANRNGRCPIAAASARLGSPRAGAHLHLLLEEIGAAWPDPFAVSPPCCRRLSHDEALLADMVALAAADERPAFDRLLADLLPADARERLFLSAGVLSRFLGG
jgi:hypothetical protein